MWFRLTFLQSELLKALTSLFSSAMLPLPLARPDLLSLLSAAFSGLLLPMSSAGAFQLAAVDLIACLSSRRPDPEDIAQRVVEVCRCYSQLPKQTRAFKPQVLGVRVSLVSYLLVRLIDGPDDPPKSSPLLEETCAVSLTQTKLLRDVVRMLKSSADKWQRMTTTAKLVLQHMLSAALVEGSGGTQVQKLDTKAFKTLVKQLCSDMAVLAGACYPAAMTCLIVMSVHFRHIFTGSAAEFATGTKETILGFIAEVLDGLQGFTESPSPFFPLNTGEVCKLPCSCGQRLDEASKETVECQDCNRRIHRQCLGVYHEAWRCDACSIRQAAYKSVRHLLLPLAAKVVLSGLTTRGRRVLVQSDRPADDIISTVDVRQVMGELDGGLLLPALTEDAIYACYCLSSLGLRKHAAAASLHALASSWTFKTERDTALQTYTSKDSVDLVEGLAEIGTGLRHVSLFLMMSVFTHTGDVSLAIHDHSLAALRRHFSTRLLKRVHSLLFRLISMASSSPFASLRRAATMSFVACSKQNASFLRRLPETRDMIHVMLADHSARVRERALALLEKLLPSPQTDESLVCVSAFGELAVAELDTYTEFSLDQLSGLLPYVCTLASTDSMCSVRASATRILQRILADFTHCDGGKHEAKSQLPSGILVEIVAALATRRQKEDNKEVARRISDVLCTFFFPFLFQPEKPDPPKAFRVQLFSQALCEADELDAVQAPLLLTMVKHAAVMKTLLPRLQGNSLRVEDRISAYWSRGLLAHLLTPSDGELALSASRALRVLTETIPDHQESFVRQITPLVMEGPNPVNTELVQVLSRCLPHVPTTHGLTTTVRQKLVPSLLDRWLAHGRCSGRQMRVAIHCVVAATLHVTGLVRSTLTDPLVSALTGLHELRLLWLDRTSQGNAYATEAEAGECRRFCFCLGSFCEVLDLQDCVTSDEALSPMPLTPERVPMTPEPCLTPDRQRGTPKRSTWSRTPLLAAHATPSLDRIPQSLLFSALGNHHDDSIAIHRICEPAVSRKELLSEALDLPLLVFKLMVNALEYMLKLGPSEHADAIQDVSSFVSFMLTALGFFLVSHQRCLRSIRLQAILVSCLRSDIENIRLASLRLVSDLLCAFERLSNASDELSSEDNATAEACQQLSRHAPLVVECLLRSPFPPDAPSALRALSFLQRQGLILPTDAMAPTLAACHSSSMETQQLALVLAHAWGDPVLLRCQVESLFIQISAVVRACRETRKGDVPWSENLQPYSVGEGAWKLPPMCTTYLLHLQTKKPERSLFLSRVCRLFTSDGPVDKIVYLLVCLASFLMSTPFKLPSEIMTITSELDKIAADWEFSLVSEDRRGCLIYLTSAWTFRKLKEFYTVTSDMDASKDRSTYFPGSSLSAEGVFVSPLNVCPGLSEDVLSLSFRMADTANDLAEDIEKTKDLVGDLTSFRTPEASCKAKDRPKIVRLKPKRPPRRRCSTIESSGSSAEPSSSDDCV